VERALSSAMPPVDVCELQMHPRRVLCNWGPPVAVQSFDSLTLDRLTGKDGIIADKFDHHVQLLDAGREMRERAANEVPELPDIAETRRGVAPTPRGYGNNEDKLLRCRSSNLQSTKPMAFA
jgi:hypothetical protein